MSEASSAPVESTVREIRWKTRKKYMANGKVRMMLEGLRGETPLQELCHRVDIHTNM